MDWVLVEVDMSVCNYTPFDAIYSYLVEHPDHFYMAPNNQWLCYLVRGRGLLMFTNDFNGMTDEEISDYLIGALEMSSE